MLQADATDEFCWHSLRSLMTAYSEHKLREFAAAHASETFYCLCVYFDSIYGDYFLYLNDPDSARQLAVHCKEVFTTLYGERSIEDVESEVKWNCGDFRYGFVNLDDLWKSIWRPIQHLFESLNPAVGRQGEAELLLFGEKFADTACLVALDLERSPVLDLLRRTSDFRVICVDHDETFADSEARLNRVRATFSPLKP